MDRCVHHARFSARTLVLVAILGIAFRPAYSDDFPPPPPAPVCSADDLERRLLELEQKYSKLLDEHNRFQTNVPQPSIESNSAYYEAPAYDAGYAKGFVISPRDPQSFPYELRFNNQAQIRYVRFARGVDSWTDSAGIPLPVTDRSAFELTRGRAIFSGYAFDPDLGYNLSIDYTTASTSQINFWNYWLSYRFNRGFSLFLGQAAVPGTREWLTPAINTQGPDYTLATTFFRPSLSQGIWASGQPLDGLYYRAMISNGFNTLAASPDDLDSRLTLSGSVWAEPLGEFGPEFSDFEWHDDPAIRLGGSYTISPLEGAQGDPNFPENNDLRLTDGTLLTQPGALAPGVTLNEFTVSLGAIDLAWKYRGLSLNGEFFIRELFDLRADGPIPRSSILDFGGYIQAGCFVLPTKLELYGRTSQITGPFGSGSEYAGGLNWFLLEEKQNLRFTVDFACVNQSPADQNRPDYRAGDTGLLVRTQLQFYF